MKDKAKKIPRLPMEVVITLRTKGGPQTTMKGRRGYDRQRAKHQIRESLKNDSQSFLSLYWKYGFR